MLVIGVGGEYLVDTDGELAHVVAEVDSSGTVTVLYVRAWDMLLEEIRGGVAKMYEADGLGSVRSLLDMSGARTDTWGYEAFGTTLSLIESSANPYRFAGERWVADVGMYQNRARWLDTRVGRFVSVDPWGGLSEEPLSLHRYVYASLQPTNRGDPSGLFDPSLTGLGIAQREAYRLQAQNATRSVSIGKRIVALLLAVVQTLRGCLPHDEVRPLPKRENEPPRVVPAYRGMTGSSASQFSDLKKPNKGNALSTFELLHKGAYDWKFTFCIQYNPPRIESADTAMATKGIVVAPAEPKEGGAVATPGDPTFGERHWDISYPGQDPVAAMNLLRDEAKRQVKSPYQVVCPPPSAH
jgi:RHS repeat-associated protein